MNFKGEKPSQTGLQTLCRGGILGLSMIEGAWIKVGRAVSWDVYFQVEMTTVKRSRQYESQDVMGIVHVRFSRLDPHPAPSSWDHELGGQIVTSTFLLMSGQTCINHTAVRNLCENWERARRRRKKKQKQEREIRKEEQRRHRKRYSWWQAIRWDWQEWRSM